MDLRDVVYVVGVEGTDNHAELRLSLRSLANVPHRDVWIVGHCPDWVADVWHLDTPQHGRPHDNVRNAVLAAVEQPDLTDPFMLWHDDMYAMRPIDNLPVMHGGPLADIARRHPAVEWRVKLNRARAQLRARGIRDPLAYDCIHVPQWYAKAPLLDVLHSGVDRWATTYGNLYRPDPGTRVPNAKDPDDWDDATWLSTSETSWPAALGDHIRAAFPTPSMYEYPD